MCNDVDPSSDAFVSELRITSPGKDIPPDLVASSQFHKPAGMENLLMAIEGMLGEQSRVVCTSVRVQKLAHSVPD